MQRCIMAMPYQEENDWCTGISSVRIQHDDKDGGTRGPHDIPPSPHHTAQKEVDKTTELETASSFA